MTDISEIISNNAEVAEAHVDGKEVTEIHVGAELVWQASNFVTADGAAVRTADGESFNCKKQI